METVVAEYHDLNAAERAVRALERHGLSIQNISISDDANRFWRKSHPAWLARSLGFSARRGLLLGLLCAFVAIQLGLQRYLVSDGDPARASLIWAVAGGGAVLGSCLGALLGSRRAPERSSRKAGFYVILRANAAARATVTHALVAIGRLEMRASAGHVGTDAVHDVVPAKTS